MSMSLPFGAGVSGLPGSRSQHSNPSSTTPAIATVTVMVDDDDDDDYDYDVIAISMAVTMRHAVLPRADRCHFSLAPTNN
jgi:hypothetical protein